MSPEFVCETQMRHISHTYPVPVPSADFPCCPKTSSPVAVVFTFLPGGGVLEEVTENAPMQAFSAKLAFCIPCQRHPPRDHDVVPRNPSNIIDGALSRIRLNHIEVPYADSRPALPVHAPPQVLMSVAHHFHGGRVRKRYGSRL